MAGAPMGLGIFLFCLILAIVYGYFAFIRPDPKWPGVNTRNRFASVILAATSLVGLYIFYADSRVPADLGRYIPPYPGARGTHIPPTGEGSLQWLLHTDEPPEEVLQFHREEENREGWAVKATERGLLQLQRDDMILTIFATKMAGETSISYQISTGP